MSVRWIETGTTVTGINPVLQTGFMNISANLPGYCTETNPQTSLPGQGTSSQVILDKAPYGTPNCSQYATLIKPGVNPLTLRGQSNSDVEFYPVDDTQVCLQSCDYIGPTGIPTFNICSQNCIRSTTYCGAGSNCQNDAPGGLADWMGPPNLAGENSGTWGAAINNQLSSGQAGQNGYANPLTFTDPQLMKYGFITSGCECQGGTEDLANGTLHDWAQTGPGTGPFTPSTDAGVSAEIWDGKGTCSTWYNGNIGNEMSSTCSLYIQKFAQTCKWCKSAALVIPPVQPDQLYPPETTTDNQNSLGVGSIVTTPKKCTFTPDKSGNVYAVDNGDCLGFGANGEVRIPCIPPSIQSFNCTYPPGWNGPNMIGMFCNVPPGNRLNGKSCAFAQIQDLQFMTKGTGFNMNNYWVSYANGSQFSVSINGDTPPSSARSTNVQQPLTNGTEIAVVFPNGTTAGSLLNSLNSNSTLTSLFYITLTPGYLGDSNTTANPNNPQNCIPAPISVTFNQSLFGKQTSIQDIIYNYKDSTNGGNGSFLDGPITINYFNGSPMNVNISWGGSNVVNITFPNGTDANTLSNYLNGVFAQQTSKANNLTTEVTGDNAETAAFTKFYYGFSEGQDKGSGPNGALADPGNCNINLDGSKFTGTWQSGGTYTDPSSGTVEPWIGMLGLTCDTDPGQGTCEVMFYDPDKSGDCQICDSDFWDWIPGGWEAVVDGNNLLNGLATNTYIAKIQELKSGAVCDQTNDTVQTYWGDYTLSGIQSTMGGVPFCGMNQESNDCAAVCDTSQAGCSKMSWNVELPDNVPTLVDNLVSTTGGTNNHIPAAEACPELLCERNPVLTLRGTSEDENNSLVTNWLNGMFDMTSFHGIPSGIKTPVFSDPRVAGQPEEIAKRNIKAMRCCLGIDPGFQSVDGGPNGGPKTGPEADPYGGLEIWNLEDCPPGVMCPSSDTCKNLYKSVLDGTNPNISMNLNHFGSASYPAGFSLVNGSDTANVSEELLLDPAYYVKAYCELMSGGGAKTITPLMGFDDEINTLCRKAMYKYCSEPVEVNVINQSTQSTQPPNTPNTPNTPTQPTLAKSTYTLPLRIFDQGCNRWFKNELTAVMPSDYGTRDMILGSACQRLQVDGWYNPVGPDQSPLITSFINNTGQITDTSGEVIDLSYNGSSTASIAQLLSDTCNCFLLGGGCGASNCSYQYCGAGIDTSSTTNIDFGQPPTAQTPLNSPVDLTPYSSRLDQNGNSMGDGSWTKFQDPSLTAPSWSTGLNTNNFTCAEGTPVQGMIIGNEAGGTSNCYTACNYVNEYDVCWNASPTNRKYSGELLGGTTQWNCKFSEGFTNTCDPSKSTTYSCFGDCEHGTVSEVTGTQFPSCGTQTWFDSTLNLSPGEINSKNNYGVGATRAAIMDTPYWQNFYSGASEQVSSAYIPNVGMISNPNRAMISSDPVCASATSIKPYNSQFAAQTTCAISQTQSINNQGTISGSVGVSQVGSCNVSNIFQGHNEYNFLTYMGATDCTGKNQNCWNSNNFCLTDGSTTNQDNIPSGDNCMVCGSSNLAVIDAPTKPNTCCLAPSLGGGDTEYQAANSAILNDVTLGTNPVVSYFCSSGTCPTGSTDLATLQNSCGTGSNPTFSCSNVTDQETCEGCEYCKWRPIYQAGPNGTTVPTNNNHCVAVCPVAPENGWLGVGITPVPTVTPVITTSPATTTTTPPTPIPISSGIDSIEIILIVLGIIFAVGIVVSGIFVSKEGIRTGVKFGKVKLNKIKLNKFGKRIIS